MKNLILAILFLGFLPAIVQAQPGEKLRERIRIQRVAIYSDVLKLTPEEAQGFWPLYNQFLDDREQVQNQLKNLKTENLSDAEAEEQVKKHFELRQRELDLEKELVQKLRKVISTQKIARLPEAERIFRQTVLDKVREKAQERREQRRGGH